MTATTRLYAGTAAPSTSTVLVRQYYLRPGEWSGDIQVNPSTSTRAFEQQPRHRDRLRGRWDIGARHGGNVEGGRGAAGRRCWPIVAEVYGPDYGATSGPPVRAIFEATPDIVGRRRLHRRAGKKRWSWSIGQGRRPRRAQESDRRHAGALGWRGCDAIGAATDQVPDAVALQLAGPEQGGTRRVLRLTARSGGRALVPIRELVTVGKDPRESPLPQGPAAGGVTSSATWGARSTARSTACSKRAAHPGIATPAAARSANTSSTSPTDPYRGYALKWDGEWQVTYETFRDMGIAYAVGLILIYLLVVAQFGSYLRR